MTKTIKCSVCGKEISECKTGVCLACIHAGKRDATGETKSCIECGNIKLNVDNDGYCPACNMKRRGSSLDKDTEAIVQRIVERNIFGKIKDVSHPEKHRKTIIRAWKVG